MLILYSQSRPAMVKFIWFGNDIRRQHSLGLTGIGLWEWKNYSLNCCQIICVTKNFFPLGGFADLTKYLHRKSQFVVRNTVSLLFFNHSWILSSVIIRVCPYSKTTESTNHCKSSERIRNFYNFFVYRSFSSPGLIDWGK